MCIEDFQKGGQEVWAVSRMKTLPVPNSASYLDGVCGYCLDRLSRMFHYHFTFIPRLLVFL
jgi:hypothetical protein